MSQKIPHQPPKPDYCDIYTSPKYEIHEDGACFDGTFIRSYVPAKPYGDDRPKVVIYLHGFCLGAAEVYESHLIHLVKQGYYVFFPTYQHGFCCYADNLLETFLALGQALFCPYPISPQSWLRGAIDSVARAFSQFGPKSKQVDTYIFGHSLGGLFALSWPACLAAQGRNDLIPRQVIVADPVPDSQTLIPEPMRTIGALIGAFHDRVTIDKKTGDALSMPVAILHGDSDGLVKAEDWAPYFELIASTQKQFYRSQSDNHGKPALSADHVQATVDTSFLPDWMARIMVGGVGSENTLDWRYIWHALDNVVRYDACADQLKFDMGKWSDGKAVSRVHVGLPQQCRLQSAEDTQAITAGMAMAEL